MPCADGFAAAWAIWKRWPDVEFHPGVYGQAPPDVTGKHVLLVDFSYKRPVMEEMAATAKSITIIDHHKTALADLAPFVVENFSDEPQTCVDEGLAGLAIYPIQARFDMEKSGAVLAWEYAHPDEPVPVLLQYVQDRDLWRFKMPRSREIAATLFSHPYDFVTWSGLVYDCQTDGYWGMVAQGEAIERKHHKDAAELLRLCTREMVIGGHRVPVANLPYTLSSDGAGKLAEGQPFGACYYDNAEGKRVFSLRSRDGGVDVSAIAASYGGGGHAKASGFTAAPGWEGDTAITPEARS